MRYGFVAGGVCAGISETIRDSARADASISEYLVTDGNYACDNIE